MWKNIGEESIALKLQAESGATCTGYIHWLREASNKKKWKKRENVGISSKNQSKNGSGIWKDHPCFDKTHFLFFFIETSLNIFFWKLAFDDDYGDWHCHLVARFRHVDKPDRCFVNSPFRNLEHMETRKNLFSSDEKDDSVVQPGSHLIKFKC